MMKRRVDAGGIGHQKILKSFSRDNPLPPLDFDRCQNRNVGNILSSEGSAKQPLRRPGHAAGPRPGWFIFVVCDLVYIDDGVTNMTRSSERQRAGNIAVTRLVSSVMLDPSLSTL